jgi:hypothetical protein
MISHFSEGESVHYLVPIEADMLKMSKEQSSDVALKATIAFLTLVILKVR